jgi:putative ABC transport system permease protein
MGIIGVLLIVIASINYTNLTTARATNRSKEIGIRKVGGASKKSLRFQFLGESLAMAFVAGLLAALLSILILPFFNNLTSKAFDWTVLLQPMVLLFILGISILTGLLSGMYPSTYLASFNPVSILKGNGVSSSDRGWLRKGLVIVQFLISAVMVIGSMIISMQMHFIQHKDLGFDKEQILLLSLNDTAVINNVNAFMEEIERHPAVEETALSTTTPGRFTGKQVMTAEDITGEMQEKVFNNVIVNYEYLDVMGMELAAGKTLEEISGSTPMVAEGVRSSLAVARLAEKKNVEMPITQQVVNILYHGKSPRRAIEELMTRELRSESEL